MAIREGVVQVESGRFLQESNAEVLILGAPRGLGANVFGDDIVEQFAQTIQDDTGIDVVAQVLADSAHGVTHPDAVPRQHLRPADGRQLHQLRGGDGAGVQCASTRV